MSFTAKSKAVTKSLSVSLTIIFFSSMCILPPGVSAQAILNLPAVGTMIAPSASFTPAMVNGMTLYPDNPLQIDFLVDTGDTALQGEAFEAEAQKLINYFMATLTVPDNEMWVNLSPYEDNRIIADGLSQTEMGRDMLAQDYMLKQLAASLMYPDGDVGKEFWKTIYAKAQATFGTVDIPTDTFNKVWIVPSDASVFVHDNNVFIENAQLKVMLESDYLASNKSKKYEEGSKKNASLTRGHVPAGTVSPSTLLSEGGLDVKATQGNGVRQALSNEIIREVILPVIEEEVNHGETFANLRQIYHSMILATWYKKNLKTSVLNRVYADQNKVDGIAIEDKEVKEKIYEQYVASFKKGVYDYIREDVDPLTQEVMPRKYFSGGLENAGVVQARQGKPSPKAIDSAQAVDQKVSVNVGADDAMTSEQKNVVDTLRRLVQEKLSQKGLDVELQKQLKIFLQELIESNSYPFDLMVRNGIITVVSEKKPDQQNLKELIKAIDAQASLPDLVSRIREINKNIILSKSENPDDETSDQKELYRYRLRGRDALVQRVGIMLIDPNATTLTDDVVVHSFLDNPQGALFVKSIEGFMSEYVFSNNYEVNEDFVMKMVEEFEEGSQADLGAFLLEAFKKKLTSDSYGELSFGDGEDPIILNEQILKDQLINALIEFLRVEDQLYEHYGKEGWLDAEEWSALEEAWSIKREQWLDEGEQYGADAIKKLFHILADKIEAQQNLRDAISNSIEDDDAMAGNQGGLSPSDHQQIIKSRNLPSLDYKISDQVFWRSKEGQWLNSFRTWVNNNEKPSKVPKPISLTRAQESRDLIRYLRISVDINKANKVVLTPTWDKRYGYILELKSEGDIVPHRRFL